MTEYYTDDSILDQMLEDLDNVIEPELWDIVDSYVASLQDMMMIMVRRLNARPDLHDRYMAEADHYLSLFNLSISSLSELRDVAFDDDDLRMVNVTIDEYLPHYSIEMR